MNVKIVPNKIDDIEALSEVKKTLNIGLHFEQRILKKFAFVKM